MVLCSMYIKISIPAVGQVGPPWCYYPSYCWCWYHTGSAHREHSQFYLSWERSLHVPLNSNNLLYPSYLLERWEPEEDKSKIIDFYLEFFVLLNVMNPFNVICLNCNTITKSLKTALPKCLFHCICYWNICPLSPHHFSE